MYRVTLSAVLFLIIVLFGCHKNNPPVIEEIIASSDSIGIGENTTLFVDAYDEDGDDLTFTWDCAFGTLSSNTGRSVVWTAPDIPDVYMITVIAEDDEGATDDAAKMIKVESPICGEPINVAIVAFSDGLHVELTWDAPDADEPDEYIIYFQAVGTTYWVNVGTVSALTYIHDPGELTGNYRISAVYGNDEYNSDVVTTIPVHTAAVSVSKLRSAGNSGYGWDLSGDFTGSTYSMTDVANVPFVDFYITDFAGTTDWAIASPDLGPASVDSTVVPDGNWRTSWFTDPITDPQAALPALGGTTYFNYTYDIETDPTYIGIYLDAEGYFALIKFSNINTGNGTIQAETWFQPIEGLRLIAH